MAIADISDRIDTVTQDTCAGCPPSNGMLSAMNVESVSAISGMRSVHIGRAFDNFIHFKLLWRGLVLKT